MEEEDNSVTMVDVLKEQEAFEENANAVLGASDDKNCTYSLGYVKRQALYACLTCCPDSMTNPECRAGICLACSLACHESHNLIELYTKRNFRCDCAGPKFPNNCIFNPKRLENNEQNEYNQNFSGLYCTCQRPYPDPDDTVEDEMIQCIVCEDWFHSRHLNTNLPTTGHYSEMICESCTDRNDFLENYMCYEVSSHIQIEKTTELEDVDTDKSIANESMMECDTSLSENTDNKTHEQINLQGSDDNRTKENEETKQSDEKLDTAKNTVQAEEIRSSDTTDSQTESSTKMNLDLPLLEIDNVDANTEGQIDEPIEGALEIRTNDKKDTDSVTLESSEIVSNDHVRNESDAVLGNNDVEKSRDAENIISEQTAVDEKNEESPCIDNATIQSQDGNTSSVKNNEVEAEDKEIGDSNIVSETSTENAENSEVHSSNDLKSFDNTENVEEGTVSSSCDNNDTKPSENNSEVEESSVDKLGEAVNDQKIDQEDSFVPTSSSNIDTIEVDNKEQDVGSNDGAMDIDNEKQVECNNENTNENYVSTSEENIINDIVEEKPVKDNVGEDKSVEENIINDIVEENIINDIVEENIINDIVEEKPVKDNVGEDKSVEDDLKNSDTDLPMEVEVDSQRQSSTDNDVVNSTDASFEPKTQDLLNEIDFVLHTQENNSVEVSNPVPSQEDDATVTPNDDEVIGQNLENESTNMEIPEASDPEPVSTDNLESNKVTDTEVENVSQTEDDATKMDIQINNNLNVAENTNNPENTVDQATENDSTSTDIQANKNICSEDNSNVNDATSVEQNIGTENGSNKDFTENTTENNFNAINIIPVALKINETATKRKQDEEYVNGNQSPLRKKIKQERIYITECIKPSCKNDNRRKGATFWPSDWRSKLCSCKTCLDVYNENNVPFILDFDDTVIAYEDLGKIKTESSSQYEQGMEALSSLGHVQQINAITEYNRMKEKLLEFLKTFKDKKEVVREEDIKGFFAGMKPKREPDGVYFCR